MILSDRSLREQLDAGRIVIDPLDDALVQPSSIDVRISNLFRVFRNHTRGVIDVKEDLQSLTELVEIGVGSDLVDKLPEDAGQIEVFESEELDQVAQLRQQPRRQPQQGPGQGRDEDGESAGAEPAHQRRADEAEPFCLSPFTRT